MIYKEIKKDITTIDYTPEAAIAHCISCDCAMGAGVVVPICNQHIALRTSCRAYARERTEDSLIKTAYRFADEIGVVYNMFTKRKVWQNATKGMAAGEYLHNLESCLIDVREQMLMCNENILYMPQIASGLDRCNWDDVRKIIMEVFYKTQFTVIICKWG